MHPESEMRVKSPFPAPESNNKSIAIGVSVGLLLLGALIAGLLWLRHRRNTRLADNQDQHQGLSGPQQPYFYTMQTSFKARDTSSSVGGCPNALSVHSALPHSSDNGILAPMAHPLIPGTFPLTGGPWPAENTTIAANIDSAGFTVQPGSDHSTYAPTFISSLPEDPTPVEILQTQLDWLMLKSTRPLLGNLKLAPHLGRRAGGQGAVVFASHLHSPNLLYAIKLFLSLDAFETEKLATETPEMVAAMPPVVAVESDPDILSEATADMPPPLDTPLPPMIVMEKGESLDEFVARSAPDFFTSLQVIVHIAKKLEGLHAAGWVHRDLKPANAIWLPSTNSWTLIDFGSASKLGEEAPLIFTVKYAPPEAIVSYSVGERFVVASGSTDVWALGVICWELLTKTKFFGPACSTEVVMDCLSGSQSLPSEEQPLSQDISNSLGFFQDTILHMLSRDPSSRPTVTEMLDSLQTHIPLPGGSSGL